MPSRRLALSLMLAVLGTGAIAAPPAQRYRLTGEQDVASEIILHADGRFQYFLGAGALDERAEGRWTREGDTLRLTTIPKPRPAMFSAAAADRTGEAPLTVKITWPDGRGIAGVDLIVTFDTGDPVTGYTQDYGWSLDGAERRVPRSIAFAVPMHGLRSQSFPIDTAKTNRLTFVLTPNDLGVVDFENVPVTMERNRLVVHRNGGDLNYILEGQ